MKIKQLALAISLTAATAAAPALAANDSSPEKNRSAASGLIIGAVTGGPVGAFVGTVIGGEVFGRLFEQRRANKALISQIDTLQASLRAARNENKTRIQALNSDLDKVLALQASQAKTLRLPVQFKTGSADIETQYRKELDDIASVLVRNQDASVTLTGFADRRGEDSANLKLSEDRVTQIEHYLLKSGVKQNQILGLAYGESRPLNAEANLENNFFDRRVDVELQLDLDPQLATR